MGIDNAWTEEEDAQLRQWFGKMSTNEMAAQLPNRSREAVKKRLQRLDLKTAPRAPVQFWTAEEDAILRQWHGRASIRVIAKMLTGRTRGSVHSRLEMLGLSVVNVNEGWSPEEDAIVLEARTLRQAADALDRSFASCRARRAWLLRASEKDYDDEKPKAPTFSPADELDLLRQEYPGESYRNYRIPSEGVSARRYSVPLDYSPTGSSAAMCAGAV